MRFKLPPSLRIERKGDLGSEVSAALEDINSGSTTSSTVRLLAARPAVRDHPVGPYPCWTASNAGAN